MTRWTITIQDDGTPDARQAILRHVHADDMAGVLWDLDQALRAATKYGPNLDANQVRERLYDLLREHGVDLEDIYC